MIISTGSVNELCLIDGFARLTPQQQRPNLAVLGFSITNLSDFCSLRPASKLCLMAGLNFQRPGRALMFGEGQDSGGGT